MHITNIYEAKAQLSALIEMVLAGEEVIIGRAVNPLQNWFGTSTVKNNANRER